MFVQTWGRIDEAQNEDYAAQFHFFYFSWEVSVSERVSLSRTIDEYIKQR